MKEVLTLKVIAGLYDNLLDVFFDECIDVFAATSIVANFDRVVVVARMNVDLLCCVITVDVEDLSVLLDSTLKRLLANPA